MQRTHQASGEEAAGTPHAQALGRWVGSKVYRQQGSLRLAVMEKHWRKGAEGAPWLSVGRDGGARGERRAACGKEVEGRKNGTFRCGQGCGEGQTN